VYTVALALAASPILLALWTIGVLWPGRRVAARCGKLGARALLRLAGVRVECEGLEHLAGGAPFVLASNHASYLDVPLLVALLPLDFLFVAKREMAGWPLVARFARKIGHLTVDRFDAQQGLADAAAVTGTLAGGRSVLFFPEATFTHVAGLRPFRLGAFKAAVEAGVPLVPIALSGTRAILRAHDWRVRPGRVRLWVGAPLRAEGEGWRAVVALRDRVAEQIGAHSGELRLELAGGPIRR
jgi:1-acyl-sn-glycerol-3-phosphate acyltransferase